MLTDMQTRVVTLEEMIPLINVEVLTRDIEEG